MVTRSISTYFNLILWMMLTILHSTVLGNSNETEVEPTTTEFERSKVTNDYHYTTMTNDDVAIGDRIIQIWEEWKLLIVVGGSTLLFLCIFCVCIICCIKRKKKRRKKKRKNVSRKPSTIKIIKKSPKVSDGCNGTTIYTQIPNSPLPDDETDIEEEKKSDAQPMIAISKQPSYHDVISSDSGSSGMYEPVVDDNDTKTRGSVFDNNNNNNDLSDSSSDVFASDNNKNTVVNIEMVPNNDLSDTGSGVFGPGDKDQNTQKNINEDELNYVNLPLNVKQPQSYVVTNNYIGEGALSDGESGAHDFDNNKMNWDVPRCSLWVGSLSPNHKKYAKAFKENGVDGKILNDMMVEPKLLKEIVPSRLHRKKIENEWKMND